MVVAKRTFENRNIFNMTLTGIMAKTGSNVLMTLSTLPNFLMSLPNLLCVISDYRRIEGVNVLVNDFAWENVGPELGFLISPKADLHVNI